MIFLNMCHSNCALHCVHFIALSHEAKSEWYRTQTFLQNSVEEGASAPMLQVERKSPPSAAEFAFEGQDTFGQDCSLEVCRCTVVSICLNG